MPSIMSIVDSIKGLPHLVTFLTTIPLAKRDVVAAAKAFPLSPLIGLLEASIVYLTLFLSLHAGFSGLLTAAIALLAHIIITGGLHLDGLADYADVLGSRRRGYEALKILKDSRRGSYAIISVLLVLLVRLAILHDLVLSKLPKLFALLSESYVAAFSSTYLCTLLAKLPPYHGLGKLFIDEAKRRHNIILHAATVLLILLLLSRWLPVYSLLAVLLVGVGVGVLVSLDANRRLGFVNGDVLGFTYEVSLTMVLASTLIVG